LHVLLLVLLHADKTAMLFLAVLQGAAVLHVATALHAATACPCSDEKLCEPLTLGKRPEVVAFENRASHGQHGDGW